MDSVLLQYDDKYFRTDRKLGWSVLIDGDNIYDKCNADLIDYNITPAPINKEAYKRLGQYNYRFINFSMGNSSLQLEFYVGGNTTLVAQKNVNRLLAYFVNKIPVIKIGDTEFEYVCIMSNVATEDTTVKHYYKVTITADVIKRLPISQYTYNTFSSSQPYALFDYNGSIESGANIIFVTNNNQSSLSFYLEQGNGKRLSYKINNTNGQYNVFNINGMDGKVYAANAIDALENGTAVNWFLNSEFIDFPSLYFGKNKIYITSAISDVSQVIIKFHELFVA